ncbi:hypothetical protein JHK82_050224 [Glycine max]|nr:hypothetical protein JHK82_050224 [Glycine max]
MTSFVPPVLPISNPQTTAGTTIAGGDAIEAPTNNLAFHDHHPPRFSPGPSSGPQQCRRQATRLLCEARVLRVRHSGAEGVRPVVVEGPEEARGYHGMGLASVFGNDVEGYYEKLLIDESGITPIDRFDASKFPTRFGDQIRGFSTEGYIDGNNDRRLDDCLCYCHRQKAKVKGLIMAYLKSIMLTKLPEYILIGWDIVPSAVEHTSIRRQHIHAPAAPKDLDLSTPKRMAENHENAAAEVNPIHAKRKYTRWTEEEHRNERIVSRAIELNEQVQKFLARHDSLLSGRPTTIANHLECEEAEEGSYVSLRFIH